MNYFFSIIIPVYNSESVIKDCISSITQQKRTNVEILIVDDNSQDASLKICKAAANKNRAIKIYNNKKNLGVSITRNKGIKNAKGKYIIFLDSDDQLYKATLAKLEKKIVKDNFPEVVVCKFKHKTYPYTNNVLIKNKIYNTKKPLRFIKKILLKKFPLDECWPYVVKKTFLSKNKIKFLNLRVAEDQLYVLNVLCSMQSFSTFQQSFYRHIDKAAGLSDYSDLESAKCCLRVLLTYLALKKRMDNIYKIKLVDFYIQNIFSMFTGILLPRSKKEIFEISKLLKKKEKYFKNLIKIPEMINFEQIIKKEKANNALFLYKKTIIETKKEKIFNSINKSKEIFIFCYSKFAMATMVLFSKNKKKIKGIIDDNQNLKGKSFKGLKIINSKVFFKQKNKKTFCIVANHREITLKKIYNQLKKGGLTKSQILLLRF
tara:strand:+ start:410 stop:1702 length:1293 start_codon:yes stop_codon:yes gene_type:complete